MKKEIKLISLLVLSWVLIMNSAANATLIVNITEDNLEDYSFTAGGTIEVVDTPSAPGTATDWSLELVWPTNADDAGIQITDLGDPLVSSISGYSYWVKASAYYYNSHLTMFLDTTGDDSWDTEARIRTFGDNGSDWSEIDSSGIIGFYIIPEYGGSNAYNWTWDQFRAEFGDATVEQIGISHHGYSIGGITTYLDDFTFGDTDYAIGIPEPATIALLGLGSIFLLRRRR